MHPDYQRHELGVRLVQTALQAARARGIEWVHVDYEPHLIAFYARGGFRPTQAGILYLKQNGVRYRYTRRNKRGYSTTIPRASTVISA